ncbi:MAG: outer membrane protein insertion porin family [Polaribacter sp.]|jgi:outer membrane protein insertion porin family
MKINSTYKITTFLLCFFVTIALSSCSLSRSIPEGNYLYVKSKIKVVKKDKKIRTKQLESTFNNVVQQQKPNKKRLGFRFRLRKYNLFIKVNKKRIAKEKKDLIGEPPVIYSEQITKQTRKVMKSKAFNEGFFNVVVTSEVNKRRKRVKVKYTVVLGEAFTLASIKNQIQDSLLRTRIRNIQSSTLLKTGERYDLNKLKRERVRIALSLREQGFYFFSEDYLLFKADTIKSNGKVQLTMNIKEEVDPAHLGPKGIDRIIIYPDFNTKQKNDTKKDSINLEGLTFIYKRELMKHSVLRDAITLKQGSPYSITEHQHSLERLSYLRNYQFIDIRFVQSEKADSLLNVFVKLSPKKRDAVEGSLGFSLNSGLYAGPEVSMTYLNRNIFRGAEQFKATVSGTYNFPLVDDIPSQREQNVSTSLTKPSLLIPFRKNKTNHFLVANTKFEFSYNRNLVRLPLKSTRAFLVEKEFDTLLELLNQDNSFAPFVALNKMTAVLSYQWRHRPDIQHELSPINITFQNPIYEEAELRDLLLSITQVDNESEDLQLGLEKMIILKPSYTFIYDSRLKRMRPHNYYYRGKMALVGNRLLSSNSAIPSNLSESQFFQIENDIRYFRRFSRRQTIATRLSIKASIPFNNEVILPFFDLYTAGGPNSIRSVRPRAVGPGSVVPTDEIYFFTGTGDILLESSIEWRPKVTNLLELGFFVDAGNTWLFNSGVSDNELATFKFDTFYKQLAIGTGMGFRLDFEFVIFRFDLALPLTKPWLAEGERFVAGDWGFGAFPFLREDLVLSVGIGYGI